jgi:WD40 repeat protein/class 3 adenylate cyclase
MVKSLIDEPAARPTVLTFVIADVRGYTRFTKERGDAAAAMLAKRFADLAREAVEARGGRVLELRGDEALAVFESAEQAVRAAVEFQATCAEESEADPAFPLPVGIGIDVGEAVPVEDGYRGVAINMAARLCSSAAAGEVLLTRSIARSVGRLGDEITLVERGPASFKGFDQAVEVIEAVGPNASEPILPTEPAIATDLPPDLDPLTPLVDRTHEMRWLRGTWRQARRGHGRVVLVSGPAQMGKTRLAAELAAHVAADAAVVRYAGPGGAATAIALAEVRRARVAASPTLLVLDDVDVAGSEVARELMGAFDELERRPVLVVGLVREAAEQELAALVERADERGDGHRTLRPLDLDGVRGIAQLYVGEDDTDLPLESMVRASGGVPGRVHEVVAEWARTEASRRLAAAAEFLTARRDRHASDLAFANNVIGLKLGRLYTVDGRDVLAVEGCPYKGLAPFDAGDSASFFGRERLVGELAARTVGVGLLGVVGASGSGKSSVIAAGLVPSLRAGLLPGSEQWSSVTMRPGEHPMEELRSALGVTGEDPLAQSVSVVPPAGRLILVVDQLEEVFTLCSNDEERAVFFHTLEACAVRWPDRLGVVVALRGDYYGHCGAYPGFAQALAANHVLVGPLTRDELRRAIELPARRARFRVEADLTDALVEDVAEEPGGLPLLSTALVELWQAREGSWIRMAAYEATGGVRGAVARLAESSFEQLTPIERDAARRVFLRLVATGEGEAVTRRRVSLDEFDLGRDGAAAGVVARLTQDRLLTLSEDTVEVAHEALLREWPRLQEWLAEDAQGRQLRHHLTQASRQWERSGREGSELYRGARLSSALDWSADHATDLNEAEREFLAASRQAGEREAERQRRANRRLRGLLAGVAVFLVVALVAGTLAVAQRGKAVDAATTAEAQRLGAQSLVAKSPDVSLLLARQAVALSDDPETASALLAALLRWQGMLRVVRPSGKRLLRLAVSPKGDWVALSDNTNSVSIFDTTTYRRLRVIDGFADDLRAAPDGRTLYAAFAPDKTEDPEVVKAIDVGTGTVRWTAHGGQGVSGFALSPDGRTLAVASDPFIDTPSGPQPSGQPATLTLIRSADGAVAGDPIALGARRGAVFVGSDRVATMAGNRVRILDVATGQVVRVLDAAAPAGAPSMAATVDGSVLAIGQVDGSVQLVTLSAGARRVLVPPASFSMSPMAFSPEGTTLAAVGSNGTVVTWDIRTGTATSWHGQTGNVNGVGFSGDGRTMWTEGLDGTAVEWDLAGDRSLRRPFDPLLPNDQRLPFVAFSPDGRFLGITGSDHRTHLLDGRTFREFGTLPERSFECCMPPAFDRRGRRMATVSGMGVDLWDPGTRTLIRHLYTSPHEPDPNTGPPVDAQAISPDGRTVAANDNNDVLMLDAASGRVQRRLDAGSYVTVLMYSPDGSLLGASTVDGSTVTWDTRTGRRLWRQVVPSGGSTLGSFSSDGRLFATGTSEGLVYVFEARTGRPVGKPFIGDAGFVFSVSFRPRSSLVATTGTDGVVTLNDAESGRAFGSPLAGPTQTWSTGAWDPTGDRYVLAGGGRGSVFDMSVRGWEARACATAGRSLTPEEWRQFLPDRSYDPAC